MSGAVTMPPAGRGGGRVWLAVIALAAMGLVLRQLAPGRVWLAGGTAVLGLLIGMLAGGRWPRTATQWRGWAGAAAPMAAALGPAGLAVVPAALLLAGSAAGLPALVGWGLLAAGQFPWPLPWPEGAWWLAAAALGAVVAGAGSISIHRLERARWLARTRAQDLERRVLARGISDSVHQLAPDAVRGRAEERQRMLDDRLGDVVITVRRALGAHAAVLYLRRADDRLELAAFDSLDEEPELRPDLEPREGLVGWVFRQAEPFLAQEYAQPISGLNHYKEPRPIRSFLAVPVLNHGCVGVLAVDALEVQAFAGEEHRQLMEIMAGQVVHWLDDHVERGQSTEELEQWRAFFQVAHRLQSVSDLATASEFFLDLVEVVTQTDLIVLLEGRDGGRAYEVIEVRGEGKLKPGLAFAAEESWAGWALNQPGARGVADLARRQTGLPLVAGDDGLPMEGAAVCIPFADTEGGGQLRGGLVLWSRVSNRFSTAETAVLTRLIAPFQLAYVRTRAMEALERLATTDGLTGLANRRVAMETLAAELNRSDRADQPTAVVLLDVDKFKSVNDTYGHGAGDDVLRAVGRLLGDSVRDVDLAARYGGEEFLLILAGAEPRGAAKLADRVRKALARTKVEVEGGRRLRVTASFGVAAYEPGSREPQDQLLQRADEALYAAKEGGRNQVRLAREPHATVV